MGIQNFQEFVEANCQDACKPVDLLKLARGIALSSSGRRRGPTGLGLVVDAESCLDRLYGGFYSDWVCGGQWNRMIQFLGTFMDACFGAHMDLVVFFNGALDSPRLSEWYKEQMKIKKNIHQVLKHINNKGTPPPKVWWVPPMCLRTNLRLALRQLGIAVACSMDDHLQETIYYCRENMMQGIVAQNSEYIIFDPPRYFSSEHMKLTYKGAMETTEYMVDDIAKCLDLHPKRFCVLAALLGNHILTDKDLQQFHMKVCNTSSPEEFNKMASNNVIQAVVAFVRGLPSVDDLETVGQEAFKDTGVNVEKSIAKLRESVQYYVNGTQEGFMKYRPRLQMGGQPGSYAGRSKPRSNGNKKPKPTESKPKPADVPKASEDWDGDKQKKEGEGDSNVHLEAESGYAQDVEELSEEAKSALAEAPEIVIDPPSTAGGEGENGQVSVSEVTEKLEEVSVKDEKEKKDEKEQPSTLAQTAAQKLASSSSSSSGSSPSRASPENTTWAIKQPPLKANSQNGKKKNKVKVSPDVMRVNSDRHQMGIMSPWIYQILTQGEIKIDVTLEDENSRELPSAVDLYRPVRQNVYAILFDLNKQMAAYRKAMKDGVEPRPDKPVVVMKEWVIPKGTSNGPRCDIVQAEPLDWLAPGIHRLWLGQEVEDKNRRLRAFLSCMKSDVPLMLNTLYVPQHLLLMCSVLRYMVLYNDCRVLRKHELDAFLATAVSPLLEDVDTMQEMKLPVIESRGVELSALFMRGVEHALFANDACAAPVPWGLCTPWLFFDGKLFHFKLLKANNNTPLLDICDGQMEQVMRVEKMRHAILQGVPLDLAFAKPALPQMMPHQQQYNPMYLQGPSLRMRPAGHQQMPGPGGPMQGGPRQQGPGGGRGRGLLGNANGQGPLNQRGGQLQIAGVVVGNWGANMQQQQQGDFPYGQRPGPRGRGGNNMGQPPPQVMSVGPRRGRGVVSSPALRGRGMPRPYSGGGRGGSRQPPQQHQPYGNQGANYYQPPQQPRVLGGRGGGQGRGRGGDLIKQTLEQRTKTQVGGRGRGCTVESLSDGNNTVAVSQLMKGPPPQDQPQQAPPPQQHMLGGMNGQGDVEIGVFQDATVQPQHSLPPHHVPPPTMGAPQQNMPPMGPPHTMGIQMSGGHPMNGGGIGMPQMDPTGYPMQGMGSIPMDGGRGSSEA